MWTYLQSQTDSDPTGELCGTDPRNGVSFDQEDGSAVGGWTGDDVIGA